MLHAREDWTKERECAEVLAFPAQLATKGDFGRRAEVPMRELALELLEFVDDVVDPLGSRDAVNHIHTVLRDGTSADRQLAVFRETGDLRAVMRHLIAETRSVTEREGKR